MRSPAITSLLIVVGVSVVVFPGCATVAKNAEKNQRDRMESAGEHLQSPKSVALELHEGAGPADYTHYTLYKHPAVKAAYQRWRAAVENIAPARSLPDPRFTFEADISDMLMTFMPGIMFDFMTPGKRNAMGLEAAAASELAYRDYISAVLRIAANLRKSWIELAFVEDSIRLRESSLAAVNQSLQIVSTDYSTGRGMATLDSQVKQVNEAERLRVELAIFADRRSAARARFKSALGLLPADIDPPWPNFALSSTKLSDEADLWERAQQANPELGRMRAMIEMAVSGVDVARKSGVPDFAVGAMADLKATPLMIRPAASVTLPIWRDKIAATIRGAQARHESAVANLNAEQLNLAAELAQMLFMVREADRMITYIDETALPNLSRVVASAEAAVQAGMGSASMIPETELMVIGMRVERLAALRDREMAATDLLLMTSNILPETTAFAATP